MNVLIFTPTWKEADGSLAIHPECMESIRANRKSFSGMTDWVIGLENPYPYPDARNVVAQYQRAQAEFLAGAWDALLTVEHDNVLPDAGSLQRMVDTEGDVVYAPYMLRHNAWVISTWQYCGDRNLGMSLTHYPDELERYRKAGVGRVSGVGHGCTLFRRNVLEAIPFRSDMGGTQSPDVPFAEDALRAGFVSMGRFDVPVAHWDNGERLEVWWVKPAMKYRAVETVNAMVDGVFMRLVAGESYDLTHQQAADLTRAGYVEMLSVTETATMPPAENAMAKGTKRRKAGQ